MSQDGKLGANCVCRSKLDVALAWPSRQDREYRIDSHRLCSCIPTVTLSTRSPSASRPLEPSAKCLLDASDIAVYSRLNGLNV